MCDMGDCCKSFAKFILVVINLFFLLLGLLMLAFGIAMVAAPEKVAETVQNNGGDLKVLGDANYIIKAAGGFMIILGICVAVIGSVGFFGACCENKCLLIVYLIFIGLILVAQIALIIFAACYPNNLKNYIQQEMNKTLIIDFTQDVRVYPTVAIGSNYSFGYSWAATQFGARCCGVYGKSDYTGARYNSDQRKIQLNAALIIQAKVPISCCRLKDDVKFPDGIKDENSFTGLYQCLTTGVTDVNEKDCYTSIDGMIMQASRIAIGIAAAIIGFEILIIIFGIILILAIQSYK